MLMQVRVAHSAYRLIISGPLNFVKLHAGRSGMTTLMMRLPERQLVDESQMSVH
jgi:hypothetical protein